MVTHAIDAFLSSADTRQHRPASIPSKLVKAGLVSRAAGRRRNNYEGEAGRVAAAVAATRVEIKQ